MLDEVIGQPNGSKRFQQTAVEPVLRQSGDMISSRSTPTASTRDSMPSLTYGSVHHLSFAFAIVVTGVACSAGPPANGAVAETSSVAAGSQSAVPCTPLETRAANASDQRPAREGQTRTCGVTSNVAFDVTVVATGLENPWAVEPLPGGDFLVTEKSGRLRIVSATGTLGQPIAGVPDVDARGQGGLLDVALGPNFGSDRTIYWSF